MPLFCNVEITNMSESISHTGVVERIEGDTVFVRITQYSACSGCHARSMCSASEQKDKIIEVPDRSGAYRVDERVLICGQTSMGLRVVFLAFVVPLCIVLCGVVIGVHLRWGETLSGVVGLSLLLPYYYLLYLSRDKLKKRFVFTLKKLN